MDGHDSEDPKQSTADMTVFVQNLLQQMQSRFQTMSDSIITKIDEMGSRINELEQSINDLKSEMGVEGSPSPMTPSKSSADEVKKDEVCHGAMTGS
ncbi:heat shock factor-binding protein 1-like isoform X1 [Cucurbita pepo subsp. pepo]|uniref:Heat shock factor-binding protein 1-like isoform X1 n=1 Tax=Cucurbita moschata TaxID=3662 RepID=A0A6J1GM89_CUCMO|nr:heat shock factor-binding protein 1-like isoform X1 [Cucurbita moschata]XP_023547517.1 heat shock factor-binding protein 1-like isoform X1 [Cucurbita pepo subsp. pepo]